MLNQLNKYRRMTSTEQFKSGEDRMLMLKYALDLECLSMDIGMQAFEMNCARVQKAGHSYRIKMNSALKFPDSYRDLTLCLIPIKPSQNNVPREEIYVSLERVEMGYIRFPKIMDLRTDLNYKVKFLSNKVTTRTAQNALELVSAHGLKNYFTTFDVNVGVPEKVNQVLELQEAFEWENANIGMNLEQMTAVANIVNCVAYPSPYICHGPPGTGKTATLVEAVLQILKMRKDVHILISAQSNSACDEVGVRLLKYLPKSKVLRFFSPSIDPRLIDPDLKSTSNFRSGKNEYPSTEEFHFFRVVISTLVTAGRFVQMGIKPNHFDFVFIDECAAAIEPECLIAIAGNFLV